MDKIVGYIYESMDYDKFKRLPDNRDVYESRIGKLIASISEKYILNPITVNEKMEVIDGQGRFDARKKMNLPIHYYIAEGANSKDCKRMNKYNTVWNALDFAKSYAKAGVDSYIRLLETCSELDIPISRCLRLANHGTKTLTRNFAEQSAFERGDLRFCKEDKELVLAVSEKVKEILSALQYSRKVNDAFWTGVKVMVETDGYDHQRMIRNCKSCRATYTQMSSLGDQLVEFERIYNWRSKGNRLYFSDYLRNRGSNVRDYGKTYTPYKDKDVSTLTRKDKS